MQFLNCFSRTYILSQYQHYGIKLHRCSYTFYHVALYKDSAIRCFKVRVVVDELNSLDLIIIDKESVFSRCTTGVISHHSSVILIMSAEPCHSCGACIIETDHLLAVDFPART